MAGIGARIAHLNGKRMIIPSRVIEENNAKMITETPKNEDKKVINEPIVEAAAPIVDAPASTEENVVAEATTTKKTSKKK